MMRDGVILFSSLWKTKALNLEGGVGRAPAGRLKTSRVDITPIINALILLPAAIVTVYVIPLIKEKKLLKWVKIAVAAAEQLYKAPAVARRKAYVTEFLAAKGLTVDLAAVDAMIEAVVARPAWKLNK